MANAPHPPPGSPELRLGDVPNLCSYGMRPHLITAAFVYALRQFFADRRGIEEPSLRDDLWTADPASPVKIESITKWDPAEAGGRPAVVVKRNRYTFLRLGLNDQLMGHRGLDGRSHFAALMQGSHTMFCVANEAGEAERLAAEVFRDLVQFGPELRKSLALHRVVLLEFGELSRLQEAEGSYAVPVSVAVAYEEAWTLTPESPVLKRVLLKTFLDRSP